MHEWTPTKLNINTMKSVKNTSLQGISIPFKTPEGVRSIFLAPRAETSVPDSWESKVLLNLVKRRMAKVVNVVDVAPTPVPTTPAFKRYKRKEVR